MKKLAIIRSPTGHQCPFGLSVGVACANAGKSVLRMEALEQVPVEREELQKQHNTAVYSMHGEGRCVFADKLMQNGSVQCDFGEPGAGIPDFPIAATQNSPRLYQSIMQGGGYYSWPMSGYGDNYGPGDMFNNVYASPDRTVWYNRPVEVTASSGYNPQISYDAGPLSESTHNMLSVLGLVPGVGEILDLTNAVAYAKEGKPLYAALSLVSMIPGVGDAFGKGSRLLMKVADLGRQKLQGKLLMAALTEAEQQQCIYLKKVYLEHKSTVDEMFAKLATFPAFSQTADEVKSAFELTMGAL